MKEEFYNGSCFDAVGNSRTEADLNSWKCHACGSKCTFMSRDRLGKPPGCPWGREPDWYGECYW